jgi:mRNA interferase RelE/StbE
MLTPTGAKSLKELRDKKTQREVVKVLRSLSEEPARRGRPLEGPLDGLFSIHAVADRFPVLFELDQQERRVAIQFVGRRRPGQPDDVYARAAAILKRLLAER